MNKNPPEYIFNLRKDNTVTIQEGRINFVQKKVKLEFPKRLLSHSIPVLIECQIITHSLSVFDNYVKQKLIDNYYIQCTLQHCYVCQHRL